MSWDGTLSGGGVQKHGTPSHATQGNPGTYAMPFAVTFDSAGAESAAYQAWDAAPTYPANCYVLGSDSKLYRAVISNTGNDPITDDGSHWIRVAVPSGGTADGQVPVWNNTTKEYLPGTVSGAGGGMPTGTNKQFAQNDGTTPWHSVTLSGDVIAADNNGALSVEGIKGVSVGLVSWAATAGRVPVFNGTSLESVAVSNDATIASTGALTLKNVGTPGSYGDGTHTLSLTTDGQGRVTSVSANSIASGLLPSGTDKQTLRNSSGSWVSSSFLTNSGSQLTINSPTSPTASIPLVVKSPTGQVSGVDIQAENATDATSYSVRNTALSSQLNLGLCGGSNDYVTGAAQGDAVLRLLKNGQRIWIGSKVNSGDTNTTAIMALDQTGVVIGSTNTAGAKLDVTAASSQLAAKFGGNGGVTALYTTNTLSSVAVATFSNSSALGVASGAAVHIGTSLMPDASNRRLGALNFGSESGGAGTNGVSIQGRSGEAWTLGSNQGSHLLFFVTPIGTSGVVLKSQLHGDGDWWLNATGSALATSATKGFTHIPNCAGVPSGTPANTTTGATPVVIDSTHKTIEMWDGAAWVASDIRVPVSLSDATNIATDASLGKHFRVTLAGNRTMLNPTNPTNGQKIIYEVIQDSTGSRTLAWDTKFAGGTDVALPTLTTGAGSGNKRDFVGFVYNSTTDKWYCVAAAKGY